MHNDQSLSLNDTTFSFALSGIVDDLSDIIHNESYIFVDIKQQTIQQNQNQPFNNTEQLIENELCDVGKNFKYDNLTIMESLVIEGSLCPKNSGFELQGNFYSNQYKYL